MLFRKGRDTDVDRIAQIYELILMEQDKGISTIGWVRGIYPTKETALEMLSEEELFVLEDDGLLVAAGRINQKQVPEYADANWEYADAPEDKIMVLHTLVVDPTCKGKGYGTEFVHQYEKYAKEQGCPYLRMDTNEINVPARRLYKHLGYQEVGIVPCRFNGIEGVQLVCLEKKV